MLLPGLLRSNSGISPLSRATRASTNRLSGTRSPLPISTFLPRAHLYEASIAAKSLSQDERLFRAFPCGDLERAGRRCRWHEGELTAVLRHEPATSGKRVGDRAHLGSCSAGVEQPLSRVSWSRRRDRDRRDLESRVLRDRYHQLPAQYLVQSCANPRWISRRRQDHIPELRLRRASPESQITRSVRANQSQLHTLSETDTS